MPEYTKQFDSIFQHWTDVYWGDILFWQWIKAQAIAESHLRPSVVSPAGAVGIMQIMPLTSKDVAAELDITDEPLDPSINIRMGVYYLKKMWNIFKKEKGLERLLFAFGAYNAGARNIIDAQAISRRPDIWQDIADVLPQITGENALETIGYVRRIRDIKEQCIGA